MHSLSPIIDFDVDPTVEEAFLNPPKEIVKQPSVTVNPDYNPFTKPAPQPAVHRNTGQRPNRDWEKLYRPEVVENDKAEKKDEVSTKNVFSELKDKSKFFQVQNRFILTNIKSGLMVIEQQKAHERILYEQYFEQMAGKSQVSQRQLFPHNIQLSPGDTEILRELSEDLSKLGFIIESFGLNSFIVNGIYKSTDGGETRINSVLKASAYIGRISLDYAYSETVFASE